MFGSKEKELSLKEVETIIGPSVKVNGNFRGKGDVVVEGVLTGTLKTSGNLSIGEEAKVRADIEATAVKVAGEIKGNVKVQEKLELAPSAKIIGNVEAKILIVAEGALLQGKCLMLPEEETEIKESKKSPSNKKEK